MRDNPYNRVKMVEGTWVVICLHTRKQDDDLPPGLGPDSQDEDCFEAILATRSGFPTREDAARYAATVHVCYRPVIARLEAIGSRTQDKHKVEV